MRKVSMVAVMVVLTACASAAPPDEPIAKVRNAVYRVSDQAGPMPASEERGEAKPVR